MSQTTSGPKKAWTALLASALLGTSASYAANIHHHHRSRVSSDEPQLRSSSALVLDETHSSVLFARHADQPMPIASITKLLTALVVADAGQPLDEMLTVTREDCSIGRPMRSVAATRGACRLSSRP
jgi:D-alanyl-D-alanine carboxypeptidase